MFEYIKSLRKKGCKIDQLNENPIDNVLVDIGCAFTPLYELLQFTPNTLTTFSLLFGMYSVWCLYNNYLFLFVISYMTSYYFDVVDGLFARITNQCTQFGDLYDHAKDIAVGVLVLTVLHLKYNLFSSYFVILGFILAMAGSGIQLGIQENLTKKEHSSDALYMFKILANYVPTKYIVYTRWFGTGTLSLYICIAPYFLTFDNKK